MASSISCAAGVPGGHCTMTSPPWQIVYHYFWLWRQDGTWQVVYDLFRGDVRAASGKRRQPRAGGDAGRDDPSDDSSPGSRRTLLNTL